MGGLREKGFGGSGRGVENEGEGMEEWKRLVEICLTLICIFLLTGVLFMSVVTLYVAHFLISL